MAPTLRRRQFSATRGARYRVAGPRHGCRLASHPGVRAVCSRGLRHGTRTIQPMERRNPPAVPADTSPDVWQRQMAAIAGRTISERLAEWAEFNATMSRLEADAVRRRHPRLRRGPGAARPRPATLRRRARSRRVARWRARRAVIELSAAFRIVTDALDGTGTRYVVVGSTAAATWGCVAGNPRHRRGHRRGRRPGRCSHG